MNRCKRVNHHGAAGTALKTGQRTNGHGRRKTLSRSAVLAQLRGRTNLHATSAGSAASKDQPAHVTQPANSPQSLGLFKTKSGLDISQRVTELLWLASERDHLTVQMVHAALSCDELAPDDMAAVCRALEQAGVDFVAGSKVESVQSAAWSAAEESVRIKTQSPSVPSSGEQTGEAQELSLEAEPAVLIQLEDADRRMRQLLCGFGFAAHEHLARAERLLAHPSEQSFEQLVVDSRIRSRRRYLRVLPNLVKQVRAMDHKAAAAYREWRQAFGQPDGEKHRTEFRELDRKLQQTLAGFCYQTKVIQEMTATAQNIAARFQASLRVIQHAQRCRDSLSQMPLVDVERQTIEGMEEFVRMPGEMFLRNCAQLKTAETRFQQARCELIHGHLHLVAPIAETYSGRHFRTGPRGGEIRMPTRMEILYLCRLLDSTKHTRRARSPGKPRWKNPGSGHWPKPYKRRQPTGRVTSERPVI
jgi:hypothetical protein